MRVLQVIPQLETGGAERTTIEVAEALVAAGHYALVVSEGGAMAADLKAVGGEFIEMPVASKNLWTVWRNVARLARLIREQDIDIIHARSRAPALSALMAAKQTGAHFVTTYHGTYNANSSLKRWYNSIMARGERVIANSGFIRDHVMTEHGLSAGKITVIPRGVDVSRFRPSPDREERSGQLGSGWQIPDSRFVALLPARLTRWKGQTVAIEALAELKQRGHSVPLLVLVGGDQGRTAYREELEHLIAQHGLGDDVKLVGHCEDMPAAYGLADVALNPSTDPEAFGRTAAEASAAGLPVIVANHGGAVDVIDHGVTGWRVRPGSAASLADALQIAMELTPAQRNEMGAAGQHRIEARFTVEQLQKSTLQVYRELLE